MKMTLRQRVKRIWKGLQLARSLQALGMSVEKAMDAHRFLKAVGFSGEPAQLEVLRDFARSGFTYDDFLAGLAFRRALNPSPSSPADEVVEAKLRSCAQAGLSSARQQAALPGLPALVAEANPARFEDLLYQPLTVVVALTSDARSRARDILGATGIGGTVATLAWPPAEDELRTLRALLAIRKALFGPPRPIPPVTFAVVLCDPIETLAEEFCRTRGPAAPLETFVREVENAVAEQGPLAACMAAVARGGDLFQGIGQVLERTDIALTGIDPEKGFSEWSEDHARVFIARMESLHMLGLHLKREKAARELPVWLSAPAKIANGWAGLLGLQLDSGLLDAVAARCSPLALPEAERSAWAEKWASPPPRNGEFVYVFPHIPKTAGSSVAHHFREHLGGYGQYVHVRHMADEAGILRDRSLPFEWRDARLRSRARVVFGHAVKRSFCQAIPGRDAREIITLREPAERMISHYNFWMHVHERRGLPVISFDEWYANEPRDYQVFWIAYNYLEADHWLYSPPALYDLVDGVLEEFWMVSTLKTFDQDMSLLMKELGLPEICERKNVGGGDRFKKLVSLTDDLRERIRRENEFEYRLYDKWLARARARHAVRVDH